MRGVALSTLLVRTRRAADIESATTRFPDSELIDYLNESLAELYDLIRASFGEDYYRKTFTFSTGGGLASYNLPPDLLSLISVDVPLGGNLILTARPYMENERNLFKFFPFGAWTMNQPIWYRLTGATDSTGVLSQQTISFIPSPTGNYTVQINYVPNMTPLANPPDSFDGVAGWEQYAVLDAAAKCALKDKDFELLNELGGLKATIATRIEKMAAEHDSGQAERVHDIRRDFETWEW